MCAPGHFLLLKSLKTVRKLDSKLRRVLEEIQFHPSLNVQFSSLIRFVLMKHRKMYHRYKSFSL